MNDMPTRMIAASQKNEFDPQIAGGIAQKTKLVLIAFSVLLVLFFLALALIPIGGAVIGSGQLGVESQVKRIAHPTGGVIAAIFVKDGDRVKRGQLLLRLDTTVSGVSAELSGRNVYQLMAERARLEAEREGQSLVTFPKELTSQTNPAANAAMASERRLFALRMSAQQGIRVQLVQRVSQLNEQIVGFRAQIQALRLQQDLIQPEREGLKKLYAKGYVTITRYNEIERAAASLDGSIGSLNASIAEARAKITEIKEQIISVGQESRADAGIQLARVNTTLNDQMVRKATAGDQFDRSVLRAPYNGVIDKLAFAAIGDVVQPAQTVMEIVPDSERLIVEAKISPTDVDRMQVGLPARVRFTAFSSTATPEIAGRVTFVSAERATVKESGESFYRIKIFVDEKQVGAEKLKLLPGMPAEVFVSTGSRSMLSYLLKPLIDQFERSFRD